MCVLVVQEKLKKTVQYQFVKKGYIDLLQLLNLYDMFGKYFNLLLSSAWTFCDFERLYPPRSIRLSNDKESFVIKNWKLLKKLLIIGHEFSFL